MSEQTIYLEQKNKPRNRGKLAVLLAALLATGAGAFGWNELAHAADAKEKLPPVNLTVNKAPVTRQPGVTTFAPVVKRVAPSVVQVYVTTSAKNAMQQLPPGFEDHPFFRRFFGEPDPRGGRQMPMPRQSGLGSGVIVTKDGYLLTNNHVVENADEVKVAMNDGREYTAKVVGTDPQTDIAVLKIDATGLPAVEIADSDKIEIGDVALAIGNPFGVGQTVTSGIISATGRAGVGLDYEDMIQTDAAINPGNSGGALIDADGRLIGINTAILSRSGGSQGIGFAVPSNLARYVMDNLVNNGKVVRGFMGVNIQDLTPDLAKEFDVEPGNGVLVSGVSPRSPAEKAGIKDGDVIVQFNGREVKGARNLKLQVAQTKPDSSVPVKVVRDGKERELKLTVKELPSDALAANSRGTLGDAETESSDTLAGVAVADLDGRLRREFNIGNDVRGAVVTDVDPESAAFRAGLRPGDVLQEINRKPVNGADDAVRLTSNAKEKRTLLRVWSRGGSRYVLVDESKVG